MSPRPRQWAGPPRLAVVHGAHWPAVATGRPGDVPVVVVRANRVVACSPAAAAEGVQVGHRRRHAQARCPEVEVVEHDPARDARAFEPVVRAVAQLAPLVEVAEPGQVLVPTRGPSRVTGGDEALADRLWQLAVEAVPGTRSIWGVGIADGRFAATVAARRALRTGQHQVVPSGVAATARFLGPHPLRVLTTAGGVALDLVDLLGRLGLRQLADVAAVPHRDLLGRFGAAGDALHRLVTGADDRPPATEPPPPELAVARTFDDPVVALDALVFVAKQLAEAVVSALAAGGQVCTRLLVDAETETGDRTQRSWYRAEGLSSAAMVERVRWQLEGWAAPPGGLTGGVVLLRLVPEQVRADTGRQSGFWGGGSDADDWAVRAVARLAGLLGPEAVSVAEWNGGRDPHRAYELVTAAAVDFTGRVERVVPAAEAGPWPGRLPSPSPAITYADPTAVEVCDDRGAVVRVSGRGTLSAAPARLVLDGAAHEILAWAGPWPVEERWWDHASRRAARFQVVLASGDAHLVEVQGGQWRLTASYV